MLHNLWVSFLDAIRSVFVVVVAAALALGSISLSVFWFDGSLVSVVGVPIGVILALWWLNFISEYV